jgi:DNA-binding beta-propeller fold protein YncE
MRVPIDVKPANKAVTPAVVANAKGEAFALVFHDHEQGADATDALSVIALDPNRDGDCADAKLVTTLPVGNSQVVGHGGHHAVAADADGRLAFVTNPGDGTISVLSLEDWRVKAEFKVGGKPTAIVAHGGRETDE